MNVGIGGTGLRLLWWGRNGPPIRADARVGRNVPFHLVLARVLSYHGGPDSQLKRLEAEIDPRTPRSARCLPPDLDSLAAQTGTVRVPAVVPLRSQSEESPQRGGVASPFRSQGHAHPQGRAARMAKQSPFRRVADMAVWRGCEEEKQRQARQRPAAAAHGRSGRARRAFGLGGVVR